MFNWSSTRDVLRFSSDFIQSSSFLFKEQLDRVEELCNIFDTELNNNSKTNKVISVVGERGTGKSTFLNVLDTHLKCKEYLVLDKIDPSIFDDSISIMELFVARVYEVVSNVPCNQAYVIKDSQTVDVIRQLNDITRLLISLKNKDIFYKENSTTDVIQDTLGKIGFSQKIQRLVKDTLTLMNTSNRRYKNIVMIVDDLDLVNNRTTYQMLDYIQKYLATNIIVIVAYRNKQLFNAVVSDAIIDNRELVSQGWVNRTELELQASRFIEKLLPINSRVYLFSGDELLRQNIKNILGPFITNHETAFKMIYEITQHTTLTNYDDKESLKVFLDGLLYNRARIKLFPYDSTELNSLVVPSNLRGIVFMLEYFIEMDNPNNEYPKDEESDRIESYLQRNLGFTKAYLNILKNKEFNENASYRKALKASIIAENVRKYKTYLRIRSSEELSSLHVSFLDEWNERPIEVKNHFTLNFMLDKLKGLNFETYTANDVLPEVERLKRKTSNNITLGDVWESLEIINSVSSDSELRKLIYCLKQYYSIELISSYFNFAFLALIDRGEKSKQNPSAIFLDNYSRIVLRTFLPDTFEVYESQSDNDFNFRNLRYSTNNDSYDFNRSVEIVEENIHGSITKNEAEELLSSLHSIYNLVEKITYIQYPSKGHVFISAQGYENKRLKSFKYRDIYYLGENIHVEMRSGLNYHVNPFVYFTNYKYLLDSVVMNKYVFLSMFDIDVFYRNNFYRVKTNRFVYLLRSINRVVEGETRVKIKTTLNNPWTGLAQNEDDYYSPFNEEDINAAVLFEKFILPRENTDPLHTDNIIRGRKAFSKYNFVEQMKILSEFFNENWNKNDPMLVKLYNFYEGNNTKKYVAKRNAETYKALIENDSIADKLDAFIGRL